MTGPAARAREAAAGLVVGGLAGPVMTREEVAWLQAVQPAGLILFARNVEDEAQVKRLCERVRDVLDRPLLLIDQEGGRVDRLRRLRGRSPSARELAARGDEDVARHARDTARTLRELGLNFNCAPVLDLDEGHEANGIGDRAWGREPEDVVRLARLVMREHEAERVATSLKHFPGLGRTGADTHEVRPSVKAARWELLARDAVPFRRLLDVAPSVMVSHAAFPGLGGGDRPASCSRDVIEGLLRRDLGYDGVVVTDDLEMGAVREWPAGERAVAALEAGADLLLFCSDRTAADEGLAAVRRALDEGRLAAERVLEAAERVQSLRRRVA